MIILKGSDWNQHESFSRQPGAELGTRAPCGVQALDFSQLAARYHSVLCSGFDISPRLRSVAYFGRGYHLGLLGCSERATH